MIVLSLLLLEELACFARLVWCFGNILCMWLCWWATPQQQWHVLAWLVAVVALTCMLILLAIAGRSACVMLNIKEQLICGKLLELFLRSVLWKQMESNFFLLVLFTVLPVRHQGKHCPWHQLTNCGSARLASSDSVTVALVWCATRIDSHASMCALANVVRCTMTEGRRFG